jgi:hypothetical protein
MAIRKAAAVAVVSIALTLTGSVAAYAATSGAISMSRDGTSFSQASYQYGCYVRSGQTGVCVYGNHKTWSNQRAHLNGRVEGYGWTQLSRRTSNGTTWVSKNLYDPQATRVTHMQLQLCHERSIIADDCVTNTFNR